MSVFVEFVDLLSLFIKSSFRPPEMLTVFEVEVVSVGLETVVVVDFVFVSEVGLVVVVVPILVPSELTLSVNEESGPS